MSGTSYYNIAVRLTMTSSHDRILGALSQGLLGIHHQIGQATLASQRFRTALLAAGAAFVSSGLLQGFGHLVERGGEFTRILSQMTAQAWPRHLMSHAVENAFTLSRRYPTITPREILEMTKEMAPVLGDRGEALHVSDTMARLLVAMQLQFGPERAAQFHEQVRAAVRAGELSANSLTHERFTAYLDIMARSLSAFGGTVTPRDFMMATRYGRASALNWSDRFTAEVLPTIMQELGASTTGTSFMTSYQALIGGRMRLRSINWFAEMGLIDPSRVGTDNLTPEGRIRRMRPGMLVDSHLYMTDPDVWVQRHLIPAMIRRGIITEEGYAEVLAGRIRSPLGEATRKAITEQIAVGWADRTGQGLIDLLALQPRKLERDARLVRQASGLHSRWVYDEYGDLVPSYSVADIASQDFSMSRHGLTARLEALNTALTLPAMETATAGLNMLGEALGKITDSVRHMDPSTVKAILIALGVFLATVLVAAVATLIGAVVSFPALIIAAAAAALAGIGYWLHANWTWVRDLAGKIGEGLLSIPGMLAEGIANLGARIGAAISAMLNSLNPFRQGEGLLPPGWVPYTPPEGGPDIPRLHRQSWAPPPRRDGGLVPIHNVITVDGHKIAEAVSYYIAAGSRHVNSAARFDNGLSYAPPDLHYA